MPTRMYFWPFQGAMSAAVNYDCIVRPLSVCLRRLRPGVRFVYVIYWGRVVLLAFHLCWCMLGDVHGACALPVRCFGQDVKFDRIRPCHCCFMCIGKSRKVLHFNCRRVVEWGGGGFKGSKENEMLEDIYPLSKENI